MQTTVSELISIITYTYSQPGAQPLNPEQNFILILASACVKLEQRLNALQGSTDNAALEVPAELEALVNTGMTKAAEAADAGKSDEQKALDAKAAAKAAAADETQIVDTSDDEDWDED